MKNSIYTIIMLFLLFIVFLSACSNPRYTGATHHHGVDNRHYSGY